MKYLYNKTLNKAYATTINIIRKNEVVWANAEGGGSAFFRHKADWGYNYFDQLFRLAEISIFGDSKIEFSTITKEERVAMGRNNTTFKTNMEIAQYNRKENLKKVIGIKKDSKNYYYKDELDAVSIYYMFAWLCPVQEGREFKIVDDVFLKNNPSVEVVRRVDKVLDVLTKEEVSVFYKQFLLPHYEKVVNEGLDIYENYMEYDLQYCAEKIWKVNVFQGGVMEIIYPHYDKDKDMNCIHIRIEYMKEFIDKNK